MKTVRTQWDAFAQAVLPADCSKIQRTEMRRAFYAGCRAMLTLISEISDEAATDDVGAARIELLSQELKRFNDDVKGGRA